MTKIEAQILIDDIKNKEQEEKDRKKIGREQARAEQEKLWNTPTPKQLAYLDYHSVKYSPTITKGEASDLISATVKRYPDSDWNKVKHNIRPDLYEYFEREGTAKREYERAVAELARLQSDTEATEDDIQEASDAVKDAKEEIQSEKEELADEMDDWDLFLGGDEWEFPNTMENISNFKSVFKKPSKSQIKAIRDRLEKHYRIHFDEVSKEQFFLVYKLLYPDCIKKGKRADFSVSDITFPSTYSKASKGKNTKLPRAKSKGGCWATIVKVCLIIFFIMAGLIILGAILPLLHK